MSVQRARTSIVGVRNEVAALDDEVRALQKTATEIRKQVEAVHSDLKFEAETLGNTLPDDEERVVPLLSPVISEGRN